MGNVFVSTQRATDSFNVNLRDADPTTPTPVEPAWFHASGSLQVTSSSCESSLPSPSPNALPEGLVS